MDARTNERIRDLENAIRRLDQLVTGLYQHLGIPFPDERAPAAAVASASADDGRTGAGGLHPDVAALADAGKTIDAIKLHRSITGAGLGEAKDAIEAYERRYRLG
jgi:ribosomal protein L7/L12